MNELLTYLLIYKNISLLFILKNKFDLLMKLIK